MSYRVRVGPELTREKAEQLQQRLAAATKLTGIVLQYP
jgi:cell division septation protein DedD